MFCPMCGTKLSDDDNFCFNCGFKIVKKSEPAPTPPIQEPVADENQFNTAPSFDAPSASVAEEKVYGVPESFNSPSPAAFDAPAAEEPAPEVFDVPAAEEPAPEVSDAPAAEEPAPEVADAPAAEEPIPEFTHYSTDDGLVIDSYNGDSDSPLIPSEIDGQKVIGIGNNAFENKQFIEKLVLPQSIVYIGDRAFAGCSGIKKLTLPLNAVFTDKNAFEGCDVKELDMTDDLPDEGTIEINDSEIFSKLVISEELTNKLMELTSIFTDLDVLRIPDHGYMPAAEESVTEAEEIPADVPLTEETPVVETAVEEVPACDAEPEVNETSSVDSEFSYVPCGEGIKITKYNGSAADVVLPMTIDDKKVNEVSDDLFAGKSINSVKVRDFSDKLGYIEVSSAEALREMPVDDIYKGMINAFAGINKIRVPYYTDKILNDSFRDNRELTAICVSQGVTSVANAAFKGCKGLISVRLPDSITSIGENVFEDCTHLETVKMPFEIRRIGTCAFSGCKKLTDVRIPNGITVLEGFIFEDCSLLSEVVVPPSVSEIGKYAFYSCYSLEKIEIPSSVKKIGECAFKGCVRLKEVTMPKELAEKLNFPPTVNITYTE